MVAKIGRTEISTSAALATFSARPVQRSLSWNSNERSERFLSWLPDCVICRTVNEAIEVFDRERLEENKIVGSSNVIAYAMKQAWFAGFEEGRKYPLMGSN